MKIWFINHYASTPDAGAGTRHFDLGRVLARKGHDVTVFGSSFSHFSRREERLSPGEAWREESHDGVRFLWLRTRPYSGNGVGRVINMMHFLVRLLATQRNLPRPDAIVGSSPHPLAAAGGLLAARLRRAGFFYEVRDLWPQTLIDMGVLRAGGALATAFGWIERVLYRSSDRVVVLLPGAAEYFSAIGLPVSKLFYVPNGVPIGQGLLPQGLSAVQRVSMLGLPDPHRFVAGYAGAHGAANRVDVLVSAARVLAKRGNDRIHIVLIGDGPEKAAAVSLARRARLTNISFLESVPKRTVPCIVAAFDAALFHLRDTPVFRFGLSSNKLFDYLAAGRPTIAAVNAPGNPVAACGAGITIRPEDPTAMADALETLAGLSGEERAAMGSRGRAYVREHHDIDVLAERLLAVVRSAHVE